MKKSQILAALALAFALGVVAPVSSASAWVMAGEGRNEVIANIEKSLKAADALGNCTEGSKNVTASYSKLIGDVNALAIDQERAINSAYTTLKSDLSTAGFIAAMNNAGTDADNAAWKTYNGTEVNAYATYDALKAYAEGLLDSLQAAYEGDATFANVKAAADLLRKNDGTGYITAAETTISNAETRALGIIKGDLATMGQVTSGITTYTQAVASAKNMPKYGNFEVLLNQYNIVKNIKDGPDEGFRVVTAQAALDALDYDIANFCSTTLGTEIVDPTPDTNEPEAPEKPADEDDKKLPNAGNTGTIAGADATAKATVSIMAAIASVATAAFVAIRKIAAGKKA